MIIINDLSFEWDEEKNELNKKKQGLDFYEAATVFLNEDSVLFDDPDHSASEERFLIIGFTMNERLCTVCHCYRADEERIRIISARKATTAERNAYIEFNGGLFL